MSIWQIKGKKVMACPGSWAWIAEAAVDDENGDTLYVTVHYYDGQVYAVSKQSMYAYFAENGEEPESELLEEYISWKEAKESRFAPVFSVLKKVIKEMK